jgi:hypothetical protein
MKIKPEHYATLRDTLADVMHLYPEFVQRFGERGARWALVKEARASNWLCDTLYTYLNDDHINTALRHITTELENFHA